MFTMNNYLVNTDLEEEEGWDIRLSKMCFFVFHFDLCPFMAGGKL